MNANSVNSSPTNDSSRCEHRFAKGARCRLPALGAHTVFCHRHAKLLENRCATADLTATLTDGLGQFKSPAAINDFLSRLLFLLAQDRISCRRAAVLAYITNQLLHTVSAMEQAVAKPKNTPVRVIWDTPRPARENGDQP